MTKKNFKRVNNLELQRKVKEAIRALSEKQKKMLINS